MTVCPRALPDHGPVSPDCPVDCLRPVLPLQALNSLARAHDPPASPLPLWWWRCFPGEPPQVGQARSWVARLLPVCSPLDDLLIFTSELATNAVAHTRSGEPGGRFTVEVTWTPRTARVIVGDQGSHEVPTAVANPGDQAGYLESGRGLLLIDALSAAWGMSGDAHARWLWADVDWRSQGGPIPTTSIGSNSSEMQFAPTRCAYPGASPWYSDHPGHEQPGQWHTALPGTPDKNDTLTAPSPLALTHMVATRYPQARSRAREPSTPPR
jgi:serine/threonine-protein kinase RsbW